MYLSSYIGLNVLVIISDVSHTQSTHPLAQSFLTTVRKLFLPKGVGFPVPKAVASNNSIPAQILI